MTTKPAMIPVAFRVLFSLLALAGPASAAWDEKFYNPNPNSGDLILPMPCGGAMAFTKVETPAADWTDDQSIRLGGDDTNLTYAEAVRKQFISGSFTDWEKPGYRHYWIGKYEVTELQWRSLQGDCPAPGMTSRSPKTGVSWFDSVQFAQRYSEWLYQNGIERLPAEDGVPGFVRLPTEVEWEYAARGGVAVSKEAFRARTFPTPEGLNRHVWYQGTESAGGKLRPTGLLQPNPLGLYDMLGNAEEIVLEPFRLSLPGRLHGQAGGFVTKGGHYLTGRDAIRSAYRREHPHYASDKAAPTRIATIGVRLLVSGTVIPTHERLAAIAENRALLSPVTLNAVKSTELDALRQETALMKNQLRERGWRDPKRENSIASIQKKSPNSGDDLTASFEATQDKIENIRSELGQQSATSNDRSLTIGLFLLIIGIAVWWTWTHLQKKRFSSRFAPAFHDRLQDGFQGPEMIEIPGGRFQMGDLCGDWRSGEQPVHEVDITRSFALGKYPVTFEEYDQFCAVTGKTKPNDAGWGRGLRPVINVSWDDAMAYADWLSEQTGEHYRLPTEAEWEYACRSGGKDEKYAGGENPDKVAWHDGNAGGKTHPVGKKAANGLGLYDVSGNVWEWVQDGYDKDYYKTSPRRDPVNKKHTDRRVLRGGSWFSLAGMARCTNRYWLWPDDGYRDGGFRLARSAPEIVGIPVTTPADDRQGNKITGEKQVPRMVIESPVIRDPMRTDFHVGGGSEKKRIYPVEMPDFVFDHHIRIGSRKDKGSREKQKKEIENTTSVFRDRLQDGPLGPEMVEIPAGSFRMGDHQEDGDADEQPVHPVEITKPFAMGKYLVTFDEYDRFCVATDHAKPNDEGWGRGDRPVINVSWHDAVAYAEWLSAQTGEHYRLPTEAEWEYACRSGGKDETYAGGENPGEVAWYYGNADDKTHPVGKKAVNGLGLYDMSGNVNEWVQDGYDEDYYKTSPRRNPVNKKHTDRRVLRGGSWYNGAWRVRCTYRSGFRPDFRVGVNGFRLARLN